MAGGRDGGEALFYLGGMLIVIMQAPLQTRG